MIKNYGLFIILLICLAVLFLVGLVMGSVTIPLEQVLSVLMGNGAEKNAWERIVVQFRIPKALTAYLAGASLGVSGLQMQTLFRNPLAGPFVLGISAGASLGVAILGLATTHLVIFQNLPINLQGEFSVVLAAIIGALTVFGFVVAIAHQLRDNLAVLIIGFLFSYVTSAFINVLIYFSGSDEIQSYLLWTFGSFRGVTWTQLYYFIPAAFIGLLIAGALVKPLNALLLGENYAHSMGVNITAVSKKIIFSTAILAGAVTAFCGPIGFIGIAIPHLCRGLFKTSDHRILIPSVAMMGALIALISELIAQLPGSQHTLPLNVVTALFGAPVVIWIVWRQRYLMNS